ncbi:concanavalin A-like lectin/glucanase domain-containing protein [Hyaloraphidium curvatum]|nr:concanavalin A-like lectin/glucanase domain-containing protein [Hyaloraphidium curvatum]
MTGDAKGTGKEFAATIMSTSNQSVVLAALAIGGQRKGNGQFLKGDIAEVLIYDRTFLTWDESHQVIEYLSTKWGIALGAEDRNWTRAGPLGDLPQRTSDVLPLSDQANAGGWVRYDAMWDEFDGPALDAAKWRPSLPWWQGRPPAWFDPKNVAVQESCLTLTMKKDNPPEMPKDGGYKDYTSAIVSSLTSVLYGYFEVRAKPMRSAGSSSFWFQCAPEDKPKDFKEMVCGNEIDVYEMGGGAPGYEQKYNMNAHATRPKGGGTCESFGCGGCWVAPFKLADDFHVYALEWDDKWMTYYVDGVVVRKAENQCWHFPQRMIFDSETMPTWLGMPKDEDLPSTYYVDYVRAWKKP